MADFTKLNADIVVLSGKVDAFVGSDAAKDVTIADLTAKLAAVVDEQPAVDAADVAVEAVAAKLP